MSLAQGIGSFIVGYLIAKGVRVILYIVGFFLALLMVLQLAGYLTINWDKIGSDIGNLARTLSSNSITLEDLKNYVPSIVGFILGVITGSGVLGGLFRRRQQIPYGY